MLKLSPMNDQDMKDFLENGTPSTLENLVANIGEGFDNSTTGVLVDKAKEVYATIPDQRATPEQAQENIRAFYEKRPAQIVDPSSPQRKPPLSIADFKASPYFREGIEWQDGWSEERAKHLAEQYDKRKDREAIIAKGGMVSGFVGQMIGSLPDPINFIPIAEGFQAGKLITKMGAAAVEGAVGNVAVSAITRPYYADRGVDSDFADYVNDAFIGAAMGGAFAGVGHGASKLREIRANAKMKERATIGQAADKTTEAVKSGEDINVEEVVPDYKEAVKNMRKLPDLLKTEEVNNVRSQLEGLGYSKAEIDDQITPMVLQAEFFSQYNNKTFAESLADFQGAEFRDGKLNALTPEEFKATKQVRDLLDSEIKTMKQELLFAEKGGQKIFNDGQYISTTGEGTFPSWYSELGIKNKDHFEKVISAEKGPIFERVKAIAENRLINGYESPTAGRIEPSPEYQKLKSEIDLIKKNSLQNSQEKSYSKKSLGKERGAIQFKDERAIVSLLKDADRSTIVHETGHLILKNLQNLADSGNGMAKNDLTIMKKSFGFDPNAKLSGKLYEDFHEKFARGFELYLMEGKAPSQQLAGVFERFKGWLKSIYQRAEALDVNLSDDARAIYAKILGGEDTPEVSAPAKIEAPEARFKSEEELDAAAEKFSDSFNEESLKGISSEDIQSLKEVLGQIKEEEFAADEAFTLFQSGKTDDALKLLKEKGGIPKDKMDEIIDAFNNKLISEDEKRLALEKLIEEQKKILAIEAKELKRQAFLSSEARLRVTQTFQDILDAGGSARQGILAQIEGDSSLRGVKGAGNSVDGHYTSLAQSTSSRAYGELRKLDDAIEDLFENDIQFNERVAKEIIAPGSTGDNTARGAAEILSRYEDELRQRANLAGANIGKLDGHIARTHDTDKMLGKRPEWIAFMRDNLDLDKSFKGLNGMELESALSDTFDKLTTGEFDGLPKTNPDEPLFKSPRNIAKKMGESRSLHFKSAEAEVAYLKEFGQGNNILETFFGQYERTAKKIALMEKFGPNPESTITHMVEKIRKDIRDGKLLSELDDHAKDKVLKELGTAQDIQSRNSDIGEALMHALGETDTREGWFKNASRIFRSINTMSKLGSAVLSQPTDFVHAMNEKRLMTDNNLLSAWIETIQDYAKGSNEKYQEILEYAGLFVDGINYKNFNRFDADNINNKMARWNDKIFRLSGQNWHVRHAKNGAAVALSRELGNNIGKSWDQMHKGLREMMVQYGSFTKDKWEMLQSVAPLDIDGKPYYHPGMVKDIPDEQFEKVLPKELKLESRPDNSQVNLDGTEKDISGELKSWEEKRAEQIKRERFKLEADLKTFFVEEGRNIAPEPDAKIRRQMSFGTKSGSRSNEAIKLFTQFKTFAFVNWDRSIKGKRMMRDSGDYGGLIHHAAATLVLGYVSTALKDFSKGLVPADPTEGKTWGRAAFQSGGLGIMGDFLQAGISSRSGADAMSSLAGPTFSTIGNFVNLSGKTLRGDILTDGRSLTSDWVDFGRSLAPAPVSSLVWTRAAMDQLVWMQIKESLEPGSISRTKRRLKKEYNQKYLIDPK